MPSACGFENPDPVVERTAVGPQVLRRKRRQRWFTKLELSTAFFSKPRADGTYEDVYTQPVVGVQGFGKQSPVVERTAVGPQVLQR